MSDESHGAVPDADVMEEFNASAEIGITGEGGRIPGRSASELSDHLGLEKGD